jgi:hypothetical protein
MFDFLQRKGLLGQARGQGKSRRLPWSPSHRLETALEDGPKAVQNACGNWRFLPLSAIEIQLIPNKDRDPI